MSPVDELKSQYLSEEEMAQVLRVTLACLKKRRYSGKDHPPFIKMGDAVIYPVEPFRRWAKDREVRQLNKRAS